MGTCLHFGLTWRWRQQTSPKLRYLLSVLHRPVRYFKGSLEQIVRVWGGGLFLLKERDGGNWHGTECEGLSYCRIAVRSDGVVEPSGHYMYPSLTFNNSTFCPHSVFMCFMWISEQTAIISLYKINWLVFITDIYPFKAQWSLYIPPV